MMQSATNTGTIGPELNGNGECKGTGSVSQYFVGSRGRPRIFVAEYQAVGDSVAILVPGLTPSCSDPYYLLPQLAKALQNHGITTVLFDYEGCGDSEGEWQKITPESLMGSMTSAMDFVASRRRTVDITLVGYGIGNWVACRWDGETTATRRILIAPEWEFLRQAPSEERIGIDDNVSRFLMGLPKRYAEYLPAIPAPVLRRLAGTGVPEGEFLGSCWVIAESERAGGLKGANFLAHSLDGCIALSAVARCKVVRTVANIIGSERLRCKPITKKCSVPRVTVLSGSRELVSIPNSGGKAIGVFADCGSGRCIVFEPGNPGTRVDTYMCGPLLERRALARGFSLLRYDSCGMGLSVGRYRDFCWSRKAQDIGAVLNWLQENKDIEELHIVSYSAGIRAVLAGPMRHHALRSLVAWSPLLSDRYDGRKITLRSGDFRGGPAGVTGIAFQGMTLGMRYLLEQRSVEYGDMLREVRVPLLAILGREDNGTENRRELLRRSLENNRIRFLDVNGGHLFSRESIGTVVERTVSWIAVHSR